MSTEHNERIERLVNIAERLIAAIEADIAALKAGKTADIRTGDPEIQRLSVLYGREAQGLTPEQAKAAPAPLFARFAAVTRNSARFWRSRPPADAGAQRDEGMIKAIADEVERQTQPIRTYNPATAPYGRAPQAMVYNKVV